MSQPPISSPAPFATATDYTDRGFDTSAWGPVVLDMRLAAASRWLRQNAPGIDDRIASGELDPELVTDIVCTMVARTAPVDDLSDGLESIQQSAGPYSQTTKRLNPHGDFYLTKQEKHTLGIGSGKAWSIDLMPNPERANH